MKIPLIMLATLASAGIAMAEDTSHQKAAAELISLIGTKEAMRSAFVSGVEPIIATMSKQGMPKEAAFEIREATAKWYDQDVQWAELRPRLVAVYVSQFTEAELNELTAFYKTPTGKKSLIVMPKVIQQGSVDCQEYAATKKESLDAAIRKVVEKYRPKSAPTTKPKAK